MPFAKLRTWALLLILAYLYGPAVAGDPAISSEQIIDPGSRYSVGGVVFVLDGVSDSGAFEPLVVADTVIAGRLIDQSTGRLITQGQIEVRDSNDQVVGRYQIQPGVGRFHSANLPPGTYTLSLQVAPSSNSIEQTAVDTESLEPAVSDQQGPSGLLIKLATETLETERHARDTDRLFRSGFINLPFGQ